MRLFGKIRQKYGRFRGRKFLSYLIVATSIFVLSGLILAWAGIFGSRSELCTIKVSENTNSIQSLQEIGINLDYIPTTNYIKNPSFESEKVFDTFVLSDSKDDCIFMNPEELENLEFNESDLIGSKAKIYTIDERGVMNLIVAADITDFIKASFGSMEEIVDTNWYWTKDNFTELISYQNVISGITTDGNLVSDIKSESFSKLLTIDGEKFVGIGESNTNVIAVTSVGSFYSSTDGKNFVKKASVEDQALLSSFNSGELEIVDLCVYNELAVALLSDGRLLLCSDSEVILVDMFDSKVTSVTSSSKCIMLTLGNGQIFTTTNALVYNEEPEIEAQIGTAIIKSTAASNDSIAILLSDNRVILIEDEIKLIGVPKGTEYIRLLDNSCVLGVSELGGIFISSDSNTTVLTKSEDSFDSIYTGENNRIILTSGGKVFETYVYLGIRLSEQIPEDVIFEGDICSVEKNINMCQGYLSSLEDDDSEPWKLSEGLLSWDIYGNGTSVTVVDEAPSGYGVKCARILGSTEDYHVLSQKIANKGSEIFIEDAFLRIEMQLMQSSIKNGTVKIWLSSEGCDNVGFVVENCSGYFSRYSNVFIASDELLKSENEIRLNIAFEGTGELRVDGIYMGLDKYSETTIPNEFREAITTSAPGVIRLNNLGIGSYGVSYESLFSLSDNSNAQYIDEQIGLVNNCQSLEDSLRLVKDSNAFPWLVIGSSADQASVSNMLDYICGSVNSEYGKKRIDNGTAVPWSRQFDRFVIEINDSDGIFLSDLQRSAYVNYVIGLFRQDSFYKDIKDNVVFLDGMNYDGGIMLSFADYHCTSYVDDGVFDTGVTFVDNTNSMYRDINNITPRVKSQNGQTGEYISSLDVLGGFGESSVSLADCVVTLLADDSAFAQMVLVNVNVKYNEVDYSKLLDSNTLIMLKSFNAINFINYSQKLYCEVAKPLSDEPSVTLEQFNSNMGVYLIKTDITHYLVVANCSGSQAQFAIDGINVVMAGSMAKRFSATGEELESEKISKQKNRYTLQDGQVLVIEIINE